MTEDRWRYCRCNQCLGEPIRINLILPCDSAMPPHVCHSASDVRKALGAAKSQEAGKAMTNGASRSSDFGWWRMEAKPPAVSARCAGALRAGLVGS